MSRDWVKVACAVFAVAWGGNQFTPLLVMYKQDDHLAALTVDVLLAVYVVGIVPAMIVGAPLSDRFGRRKVMLPAPFIAAAGSLVLALADGNTVALGTGRVLSGIALGLAMAVGTSWVKELSQGRFDHHAKPGAGAARGALSLTAGFAIGAVVAAALAQYGPWPQTLPYLVNVVLAVTAGCLALPAAESRGIRRTRVSLRILAADLKVPAAGHRRFLLVVLPMSSWVFGTAASAYAVLPTIDASRVPGEQIAFSGLLCLLTLGTAFFVQPYARRFYSDRSARGVLVALGLTVIGMAAAALATALVNPWIALPVAMVLGAANGLLMLSGMLEVQRIARDDDLAGLTALYYGGAYVGFFIPTVLAFFSRWLPYPVLYLVGVAVAAGCFAVVAAFGRRHLYRQAGVPAEGDDPVDRRTDVRRR